MGHGRQPRRFCLRRRVYRRRQGLSVAREPRDLRAEGPYGGSPKDYGANDPMVGARIGGVNVGGGLPLYDDTGALLGGIGMGGDTACRDHANAWNPRTALGLDGTPTSDDIIFDIADDAHGTPRAPARSDIQPADEVQVAITKG